MNASGRLYVEIFPIRENVPGSLYAVGLKTRGGDPATVGGKLAYRLRKTTGSHWAWTSGRVLTDKPFEKNELDRVVEELWKEQPDTFGCLIETYDDQRWSPFAQAQADFVARGLVPDADREIRSLLSKKRHHFGNAYIERNYEVRGWVVRERPALSISVFSRLIFDKDLDQYSRQVSDSKRLEGLLVSDKTSTLKGEIDSIVGEVAEHRNRLLALTQREEMSEIIGNAKDDELVVSVQAGRSSYDYVASSLGLILRMDDFARFGINAKDALKVLRIEPATRWSIVQQIAEIAKSKGWILEAYDTTSYPSLFGVRPEFAECRRLRFGGDNVADYNEKRLLHDLRAHGLYRRSERFPLGSPIKIGVIDGVGQITKIGFWSRIRNELKLLGFDMEITGEETINDLTRADIELAVNDLRKMDPHLLLAFFPNENQDEDDFSAYYDFKSLTIGQGIPSQVVYGSTIDNEYATANIVLGILGKTGNIPFVLADPLPYADLVVGIDIARKKKERLQGTVNATAIARIYFSNGEFLRYVIHDAPLEGETIPERVLQSLFPLREFQGKRVVIHRDGYFRGDEKHTLAEWAKNMGATFHLVEVLKTGTPRVYMSEKGAVLQPSKGSNFMLSENEAIVVSSLPPFRQATPQPLRLRTEQPFMIGEAIDSVLALTLLHYGSLRPPRLPVTIHYSDKIAYLALMGIKPRDLEGTIPYWL